MSVTIVYGQPKYPSRRITPYRSISVETPPTVEPVSLAEAKTQCRIDADDEDVYITSLITAAREYVEEMLDIAIMPQNLIARYDTFPLWEIVLPRPPMAPATVTVTYRNEAGQTLSLSSANGDFQVDQHAVPPRIYPNYTGVWPAVRGDENSVLVQWRAGYDSPPGVLKAACLLLVAHWFEMRQPVVTGFSQVLPVPHTFESLLAASGWGVYR